MLVDFCKSWLGMPHPAKPEDLTEIQPEPDNVLHSNVQARQALISRRGLVIPREDPQVIFVYQDPEKDFVADSALYKKHSLLALLASLRWIDVSAWNQISKGLLQALSRGQLDIGPASDHHSGP